MAWLPIGRSTAGSQALKALPHVRRVAGYRGDRLPGRSRLPSFRPPVGTCVEGSGWHPGRRFSVWPRRWRSRRRAGRPLSFFRGLRLPPWAARTPSPRPPRAIWSAWARVRTSSRCSATPWVRQRRAAFPCTAATTMHSPGRSTPASMRPRPTGTLPLCFRSARIWRWLIRSTRRPSSPTRRSTLRARSTSSGGARMGPPGGHRIPAPWSSPRRWALRITAANWPSIPPGGSGCRRSGEARRLAIRRRIVAARCAMRETGTTTSTT